MKITDLDSYQTYFSALAASHVDIKKFYHGDIDKLIGAMKSDIEYPALWLDPYEVGIQDKLSDNFMGKCRGSLVIIKKPDDTVGSEDAAEQVAETIVKDIISKMLQDYDAGEIMTQFSEFRYSTIDPQFSDRVRGVRLEFTFYIQLGLTYNANKWQ